MAVTLEIFDVAYVYWYMT